MKDKSFSKCKPILIVIVLSVFLLGLGDYSTGHELSFFVFYLIPIAIAAWWVSLTSSCLIAILSSIVCFLCDHYSLRSYNSAISLYWNVTVRLLSFLIIAYTTSKIRLLLSRVQEPSQEQPRQLKTMSGLVSICASCKKIRDHSGYWTRIEEFLSEHTGATLTHGLCEECVGKLLKEAGIDDSSQLVSGIGKSKRVKLHLYWTRRKISQIGALRAILPRVWKSTS